MSVIASELSSSLDTFLNKVNKEKTMEQTLSNSLNKHGNFFILDHQPNGIIGSPSHYPSNTNAVSIPYSSKIRRHHRRRMGSLSNTNSPSSSLTTGSLNQQSLKESLNKTISSIIENCNEKVIMYNNSPSSSFSFTKHSTIIYSPSKVKSPSVPSSLSSYNNIFPIKKITPVSLNKESKLSEIASGLKKQEKPKKLKRSNSDDTIIKKVENETKEDQKVLPSIEKMKEEFLKSNNVKSEFEKDVEKTLEKHEKEEDKDIELSSSEEILVSSNEEIFSLEDTKDEKEEEEKDIKKEEDSVMIEKKKEEKVEEKEEIKSQSQIKNEVVTDIPVKTKKLEPIEKVTKIDIPKVDTTTIRKSKTLDAIEKVDKKPESKVKSLAKLEAKKEREMLQKRKNFYTHKKNLSLPNILSPLTPLTGMEEATPAPITRKRRKSVNFSADSFKSICIYTVTDKPEEIRNSKVEVKIDDPESDKKDKEFSELRNYENAWSPVPRNVIHIQKFKSSKAKHVQYELPVSIESFKLVQSNPEETDDKLTCLQVELNVQNLDYHKKVVIRYTVNKWKDFKEVEATYDSCIREATKEEEGIKNVVGLERFIARIPVSEYFVLEEKPGHICNQRPTKMLLVARYEVNNNTYWDNNDFTDYHIELVRINAGYDVPRVSKHGKPIPCPGCCMSQKQQSSLEKKGKEIKNNRRTVRKIGGVFGNFTDAVSVTNTSDHSNFMADKKKVNLYMGMSDSNSTTTEPKATNKLLTAEPESIVEDETENKPKQQQNKPKKEKKSARPLSYSGTPMYTSTSTTSTTTSTTTSSIYSGYSSSSKYNPPMSTTSSLYPGYSMGTSPSYGSTTFSPYGMPLSAVNNTSSTPSKYDPPSYGSSMSTTSTPSKYDPPSYGSGMSSYSSNSTPSKYDPPSYGSSMSSYSSNPTPSKYELSPYSGGMSYDPSNYGGYPSNNNSNNNTNTDPSNPSSKYNPPNEYPGSHYSKYDPPSYYNRSYSSPVSSNINTNTNNIPPSYGGYSSSSLYNSYGQPSTTTTQFSDYNFGTNLKEKAKKVETNSNTYSPYSGQRSNSKYDVPFSTYSSFGDNFSNYYSVSPSTLTY